MTDPIDPPSTPARMSAAVAMTWLEDSTDLLALTDADRRIVWANTAFTRSTGLDAPADLLALAPSDWQDGQAHRALRALSTSVASTSAELCLPSAQGEPWWALAQVRPHASMQLWSLRDITPQHALAQRAQHLSELLEIAQEFGRLGIWERSIPSGEGRWDRHVFNFWGIAPHEGTPDYGAALTRLHPEDQNSTYLESTQRAGRYAQRYRVMRPDGTVRRIHSQWEVKNSPDGHPDRSIGVMVDDTEVYDLAQSRDATAAQLKLAVELADIVIWRHDLSANRVYYNEHGFKVLGMTPRPEGMTLDEARSYTHPDDLDKLAASAALALRVNEPIDVEVRHRTKDGAWRYVLLRRVVERDTAGCPVAYVGIALDVTEQVGHSRRAEQLARRLEAAAQAARVGIWTTTAGTDHTEWNDQMYQLFDMQGAPSPPTLRQWIDQRVHPDDAMRVRDVARSYLRHPPGGFEIEFRIVRRDGQIRWMVLRAAVDRASGDGQRIFGIAMDVTDRHEALAELHMASARAALIARHAGIGTWETDTSGMPARWDDQMFILRGLAPRATALNRAERLAIVHPDDLERVIDANPETQDAGLPLAYEFRVRLPDGSYRWLASRSAALRDDKGEVVRRVGVNWDVTESKNADLARQQALLAERESQAKSQFLSRMSHELRTPLNAVLGFTQLLQLDVGQAANGNQATKLAHIRSAGEHLLTLINDVLDLSSLQAGTMRLELQTLSVRDAVMQARPLVDALARAARVTVHATALDGLVRADPTRLRQVLLNLMTNAIKYNRPGGQVALESQWHGGEVRLSVRDTGRGIGADQIGHLFEPFNRRGIESEGIDGSGIGLTIVKALVEGMGGRVDVSSQVGQGTVFDVYLPGAAPSAGPVDSAAAPNTASAIGPAREERVGLLLYIEDNSVNVLLVEELVKSVPGVRIATAANGRQGVAMARSLRPDVILVDMQLPDFDGFEVLRRLRADSRTAGLTCIALSANAMPEDIERGLAGGFDDYWTKPIKFKPFLDALEQRFPARTQALP